MLVVFHDDAAAAELHALHLQAQALILAHLPLQADPPSGAHHPLPRKRVAGLPQDLNYLPVVERVTRRGRHLGVSGDFAAGNLPDRFPDGRVALLRSRRPTQAPRDFTVSFQRLVFFLVAGDAGARLELAVFFGCTDGATVAYSLR